MELAIVLILILTTSRDWLLVRTIR